MTKDSSIPVTIVAGFLGAGKTSLINHILNSQHGRRIAVMVNDFGAINIDAELIVGMDGEMVSLSNGCICCSIKNDLQLALVSLLRLPEPPEHIVIETSGVSDPGSVAQVFYDPALWKYINLDAIITLVDGDSVTALDDEAAQLARIQVKAADFILLNKVDLLDANQTSRVRDWITQIKPSTAIFEVSHGHAPLELLFTPELSRGRPAPADIEVHVHDVTTQPDSHHEHHHELVFQTWSYTQKTPLQMPLIQALISTLPATIYRVKGFLYLAEHPEQQVILQMVGRRVVVSFGDAWQNQPETQLVFIGKYGAFDVATLKAQFDQCVAN